MNIAEVSIKRPIFISCLVIAMLAIGWLSLKSLPVDLFPNVNFPIVVVNTVYPGAGPKEIESQVSKFLEEEMSTLTGVKRMRSINREGLSTVVAEFTLETNINNAEQQVRDRVASAKIKMPKDIEEPVIRRVDPADQPILILAFKGNLPADELFDLADQKIKPKLEQINKVGLVEIVGGRKREIKVELDRKKLKSHEISATMVAQRIAAAGQDVPVGKFDASGKETVYRTLGEFKSLKDIESTIVSFLGNDVPVTVAEVGQVENSLVDEKARTFFNGEPTLLFLIYRQAGSNTISVVDAVLNQVQKLNEELQQGKADATISMVRDGARMIRANVDDVNESILIGILLTILVVYLFLANGRSTIITGLALPNSLLGAFILMSAFGFTINVMTLLALSLTVGLLIDDAIVVRENIFRHLEMGKSPVQAALIGTKEVSLAVIATTMTVIAVFGPIAFLKGMVGQFFKEFGLTICFAMLISLFDAFTVAPMLSAYFAGHSHSSPKNFFSRKWSRLLDGFNSFQDRLENLYEKVLHFSLRRPFVVLLSAVSIFLLSLFSAGLVPKTFLPAQDMGEFVVSLEKPPGTSLEMMSQIAKSVEETVRKNKEVASAVTIVGGGQTEPNNASLYVTLVPAKERALNTSQFKDRLREQLKIYSEANPLVKDFDAVGVGMRPFNVNIIGTDLAQIEAIAQQAFEKIKKHPGLKDVEISYKPGKPEFQVEVDNRMAERLGVSSILMGQELRTQVEGTVPAVFRENGNEYDIRVRLKEEQRNLQQSFYETYIPNINYSLVKLSSVAKPVEVTGPSNINRQDRGRYIQISGDMTPGGVGMGAVMADIDKMFKDEIKLPSGMRYAFVGQAEDFKDLMANMLIAFGLGILFIFLVLASLYESFVTPFTIMLVLPLAACGAFFALFITQQSLDIFSMIGCIMLMGIATKNSILLVDYANHCLEQGMSRYDAMVQAGRTRLRPILMTTVALIAGMLPVAIGLNEASRQRVSMGISIIGGLLSSTLLTLVVVPAAYSYIDRFRVWSKNKLQRLFQATPPPSDDRASARNIEIRTQ